MSSWVYKWASCKRRHDTCNSSHVVREKAWFRTVNHQLIWNYTHRPVSVGSLWERAYHNIVFQSSELLQFAAVCLCDSLLLILSRQEWMVPPIFTVTSLRVATNHPKYQQKYASHEPTWLEGWNNTMLRWLLNETREILQVYHISLAEG